MAITLAVMELADALDVLVHGGKISRARRDALNLGVAEAIQAMADEIAEAYGVVCIERPELGDTADHYAAFCAKPGGQGVPELSQYDEGETWTYEDGTPAPCPDEEE